MSDILGSDRFDKVFRSALKGAGLHIESKDENMYTFSDGTNVLSADVSELKENFEETGNHLLLSAFSVDLSNKFELEKRLVSFSGSQSMLRLLLLTEADAKDDVISRHFAGNLYSAVGICDEEGSLSLLERRFLKKWNVPEDVLFSVADRNMGRALLKAKYNFVSITNDVSAVEFEANGDPMIISYILCSEFRSLCMEKLGYNFIAAVPSSETLMAVPDIAPKMLASLKEAVIKDYKWADDPVSTDIFKFSTDKIIIL